MPTKLDPKKFRSVRFAVAGFNVDRQAGILRNLCLLAAGREAKGHGLYIDEETLSTAKEVLDTRKQLKGAIRHPSWDEYFSKGADRVLDFPGWFEGFEKKGEELVALKFEFFETFRNDAKNGGAESFARIMEMADKTPTLFGLSIEAWGYAVFVAKDGKEYGTKPDGVELKYDGVPALRVTDLFFAAFVDEPAATDGIFARFSAAFPRLSSLFAGEHAQERTALATEIKAFVAQLEAGTPPPKPGEVPVRPPNEDHDFSATMKIIADLKAKFTDATRFAAAMSIVGNTPPDKLASLTVGEVEQQLVAVDLAAATKLNESLKADLAAEQKKVVDLGKKVADLEAKFEKFKKSGRREDLDLGAETSGAIDAGVNPYAAGPGYNLTAQIRLEKEDPARAAQLKAAAGPAKAA